MSLYFDQLAVLVSTDFKLKYNSTALGFLWSVLAPTAQAAVYFLVFSNVARFDIPDYFLYMISGMFFWHFFTSCLQISRKCFVTHGALIKKTNFNRSLLIVGMTMTEFLHLLLVIPILLLIMLGYSITPDAALLKLLIVLPAAFFFAMGFAYAIATINLYLRDMERILSIIIHMWFFASPVLNAPENVRGGFVNVIAWNPMLYFLEVWRGIFYRPDTGFEHMLTVVLLSVGAYWCGKLIYRLGEPGFAEQMYDE